MKSLNTSFSLTGIELEKEQLQLVKTIKMCEHEQLMEYVLFMIEFSRYLKGLTGKWSSNVYSWLKILSKYSKLFGLPKSAHGYIQLAKNNRSKVALLFGLKLALEYFDERMKVLKANQE